MAGFQGIDPQRLERQAEGLALLDAEIVALVEINPPDTLHKFEVALRQFGLEYESLLIQQEEKLHIGVLFKKGVKAENPLLLQGSDLGDSGKRKAFVVDMEVGKFDFKLVVVHLKAGRGAPAQKIRDEQCQVIGEYISDLRSSGRTDILLVGDFNMIPGQDISNFHHLGGDDLMDFLSSWDLQARFSHIAPKGRPNLLDGFAISRTFSTEYVRGSLRLFPMHWAMNIGREEYRKTVSDHLPFVATFRIDRSRG